MSFCNKNTGNVDWLTPPYIIQALREFDYDPCCPYEMPWATARYMNRMFEDGLAQSWSGRVWLNPPYGKHTWRWVEKLAKHGNGIALIFARTDTAGFHKYVWGMADSVFFFKGRLRFYTADGLTTDSAPAPSCLVAYGGNNVRAIANASVHALAGCHVVIKRNG